MPEITILGCINLGTIMAHGGIQTVPMLFKLQYILTQQLFSKITPCIPQATCFMLNETYPSKM
jgi:hypothetical protein